MNDDRRHLGSSHHQQTLTQQELFSLLPNCCCWCDATVWMNTLAAELLDWSIAVADLISVADLVGVHKAVAATALATASLAASSSVLSVVKNTFKVCFLALFFYSIVCHLPAWL